jgi:tetratricopeptide (TPR) repeat protein
MHRRGVKDNSNLRRSTDVQLAGTRFHRHLGALARRSTTLSENHKMQVTPRSIAGLTLIILCACTSGDRQPTSSTGDETSHLWPLSTKSEDARKWTDAGEVSFDAGLFDDALRDFKRAVAADSAFAYGYLRIAQNGNSLDEYRANLQRANAFVSTANPSERLLIEAESRIFAGDVQAGLDSLRKLTETLPDNPRALIVLGLSQQFAAGQTDSSRATMKRAMDLAPTGDCHTCTMAQPTSRSRGISRGRKSTS